MAIQLHKGHIVSTNNIISSISIEIVHNGHINICLDCGAGAERVFGRDLVDGHALCCVYAGIDMAGKFEQIFSISHERKSKSAFLQFFFVGTNAEVMPSQWEYQGNKSSKQIN